MAKVPQSPHGHTIIVGCCLLEGSSPPSGSRRHRPLASTRSRSETSVVTLPSLPSPSSRNIVDSVQRLDQRKTFSPPTVPPLEREKTLEVEKLPSIGRVGSPENKQRRGADPERLGARKAQNPMPKKNPRQQVFEELLEVAKHRAWEHRILKDSRSMSPPEIMMEKPMHPRPWKGSGAVQQLQTPDQELLPRLRRQPPEDDPAPMATDWSASPDGPNRTLLSPLPFEPSKSTMHLFRALQQVSINQEAERNPESRGGVLASTMSDWRHSTLAAIPPAEVLDREEAERRVAHAHVPSISSLKKRSAARRLSQRRWQALDTAELLDAMYKRHGMLVLADKWDRVQATCLEGEPFSEADVEDMRVAFKRFMEPIEQEMDKKGLEELVQYIGYVVTSPEDVQQIAEQITFYSTLSFDEFLEFASRYAKHECQKFKELFKKYDEDGSGEISTDELRKFMFDIGFVPRKSMIQEAVKVVDVDDSGSLSFREFVHFLTVYRHSQGFPLQEVARLRNIFERVSKECKETGRQVVTTSGSLVLALVQMFGHQVEASAKKLTMRMLGQGWLRRAEEKNSYGEMTQEQALHFPEFLIFARRLKELEQERYLAEFKKHDKDGSGSVSIQELHPLLRALGYEPMWEVISEVLKEVDFEEDGELDVSEFFNFVELFLERDGYTCSEVDELQDIFNKFDRNKDGSIDIGELEVMFKHLGWRVLSADLTLLVREFDWDNSGALDFFEFRRLMRRHREGEIKRLREVFNKYMTGGDVKAHIPHDSVHAALTDALHEPAPAALVAVACDKGEEETEDSPFGKKWDPLQDYHAKVMTRFKASAGFVDFRMFVELADHGREVRVERERTQAGFSDPEINQLWKFFNLFDKNKNGIVDAPSLPLVLRDLRLEWKTRQDQKKALKMLEDARGEAKKAGFKPVGTPGTAELGFGEFVHLVRRLLEERDVAADEQIERTANMLGFTWNEVKQFREIFTYWAQITETSTLEGMKASVDPYNRKEMVDLVAFLGEKLAHGISPQTFVKIIGAVGLSLSLQQRQFLEHKAASSPLNAQGHINFVGFLHMMRWLMDTNYGGINEITALKVQEITNRFWSGDDDD